MTPARFEASRPGRPDRGRRARWAWLALALGLSAGCGGAEHHARMDLPAADQVALGRKAVERRDYSEAIELLKGYVAKEPAGDAAAEAHYLLGVCYYRTKEWPSAVTEFLIVINQFTDSSFLPDAHYHLGLSYWRQSRPSPYDQDYTQRAVTEFDRFLELYPEHPRAEEVRTARTQARDRLAKKDYENGRIYLRLGQLGPALFYFQQVQSLYPESGWAQWAKLGEGKVYLKQEKWEEAQSSFDAVLQGNPAGELKREAERGLAEVKKKRSSSAAPREAPAGGAGSPTP